ncbi:MAG: hypothetical protein NTW86_03065 [Candidatus Sumerlaeota bacterium]|nr:hypothetical protein [Candidatus Sumerlaeota bacterium]
MAFWISDSFRGRYRPLHIRGFDGLVDVDLYDAMDAAQREDPLALLRLPGIERVKDSRNELLRASLAVGGAPRSIWIKRFRPLGPISWLRYAFRQGKAQRAWNMAFALLGEGLETPRPLLGLRGKGAGGGASGLLATEDAGQTVAVRQLLREWAPGSAERARLIEDLASFVAQLHSRGFCHRDLSGGNILARELGPGRLAFLLIDINRMRRFGALTAHQRLRDLERIRLDESDIEVFFSAYSAGCPDAGTLRAAYRARAERYRRMRETRSLVERLALKARYYWDDLRG